MGAAKSSNLQCDDQFAGPVIDKPTSAATTNQETHPRIASAATTGGVASNSPRQSSGHTPNTWTIESSHCKEDRSPSRYSSPLFAHDNDTPAIGEVPTHAVNINATTAKAHHTALSIDTSAA